jgi:hypothetical protein
MKNIKYTVKIGYIEEYNQKLDINKENITKNECYFFGLEDSFEEYLNNTNFYWSYWQSDRIPFDGNEDGNRTTYGFKSHRNPLLKIDRHHPMKNKTLDELIIEKTKKTKLDIEIILSYIDELEIELKKINDEINEINEKIFIWSKIISPIVEQKLVDSLNINHKIIDIVKQDKITIFSHNENEKSIYATICFYEQNENEFIFTFIDNDTFIKNNFCFKINNILYRSKKIQKSEFNKLKPINGLSPSEVIKWEFEYIHSYNFIDTGTKEQQSFYKKYKENFLNNIYLNLDGNDNYAFILLFDLINNFEDNKSLLNILAKYYPKTSNYINLPKTSKTIQTRHGITVKMPW